MIIVLAGNRVQCKLADKGTELHSSITSRFYKPATYVVIEADTHACIERERERERDRERDRERERERERD